MNTIRPSAGEAFLHALLVVLLLLGGCGRIGGSSRCNVVLITLDTVRADRFGCFGNGNGLTPRFDALAEEGIRFSHASSSAAVTPVSHASIMTGLYPFQHGVRVLYAASGYRLDPGIPTLATMLRENGWNTGAFLSAFPVSEHFGFDHGFDSFDNGIDVDPEGAMQRQGEWYRWNMNANQRRSDVTTDKALEWLEKAKKPFFLWIHYWDAHDSALTPPREWVEKRVVPSRSRDDVRRELYDAEVAYVDSQFGRLVDDLKRKKLYENTIFVVVADHGEGLGDHGWWSHRILYEEQIRVPLILKIPGAPTGVTEKALVRTIDIVPTLLERLDIEPEGELAGRSLRPLWEEGGEDEPRMAYADQINLFDSNAAMVKKRPNDDLVYSASDGTWKLIYRPRHPDANELYNLDDDPGEMVNLYDNEPEQAKRLVAWLEEQHGFVEKPFGESMDEETRERLRSLGYLGD